MLTTPILFHYFTFTIFKQVVAIDSKHFGDYKGCQGGFTACGFSCLSDSVLKQVLSGSNITSQLATWRRAN